MVIMGLKTPKCFLPNVFANVDTCPDGVFKFSITNVKISNSTFVNIYMVIGFNIFPPLLGLAINRKCGLMPLCCKSHQIFTS